MSSHIIIKILKTKNNTEILKAARKKNKNTLPIGENNSNSNRLLIRNHGNHKKVAEYF